MTGILRYISYFIGLVLLTMNIACNDNEKVNSVDTDTDKTEEEVELVLTGNLRTYANPVGSLDERTIDELDILVCRNDTFLYRRSAVQAPASFRTTLIIDSGLTLYLIANSSTFLDNSGVLLEGNTWTDDIRPALILNDAPGLINLKRLPMWGIKENVTIEAGKINYLDEIHMLRAVASVDIYNGADPDVFSLEEAYVYFAADKGYLAPSASLYDQSEQEVTAPESPADMQNYATPLGVTGANNSNIVYQLYMYENDAVTTSIQPKRYTRVVVGGKYKGGEITYYPVDFLEFYDDANGVEQVTILPATRNTKYAVIIDSVNSSGYTDPGDAADAFDTRMKFDIIEWNMKNERELVFDGPFYMSIEEKKVYLYKPEGSSDDLDFSTNIDIDKLIMEMPDSGNGPAQQNGYAIQNDRFRAEFIFNQSTGKVEAIRFTALGAYDEVNLKRNLQALRIYYDRVELIIDIEQINESPTQWIDGGDIPADLGEDDGKESEN